MSSSLITQINSFSHFSLDLNKGMIYNQKTAIDADIDQFLEILHILETNFVKFKMTSNFDIRLLKKEK